MRDVGFCRLQDGPSIWFNALGGVAGGHTGHNVASQEHLDDRGRPGYYFTDFDAKKWRGERNPSVRRDTLHVYVRSSILTDGSAFSTVGYRPLHMG